MLSKYFEVLFSNFDHHFLILPSRQCSTHGSFEQPIKRNEHKNAYIPIDAYVIV